MEAAREGERHPCARGQGEKKESIIGVIPKATLMFPIEKYL